jgi:hypothetical protein
VIGGPLFLSWRETMFWGLSMLVCVVVGWNLGAEIPPNASLGQAVLMVAGLFAIGAIITGIGIALDDKFGT